MEAIILAGGFGTRLASVVNNIPKPMAPVSGKPFLEILLNKLSKFNFKKVILAVGYRHEVIKNYFGSNFGNMKIEYSIENEPLGTGGAIRLASRNVQEDHYYVLNGDTFIDIDYKSVEEFWSKHKKDFILSCYVDNVSRYGLLVSKGHEAKEFKEKDIDGPGYINAGCYVLDKNLLNDFEVNKSFSFEKDFLVSAVKKNKFNVYHTQSFFIDIGVPEDYFIAEKIMKKYQDQ